MIITVIDKDYDWWPEIDQTITCSCGATFRGRSKLKMLDEGFAKIVDRECPNCGDKLTVVRISGDPESFTLS